MEKKNLSQNVVEIENGIELGKAFFGHVGKTIYGNNKTKEIDEGILATYVAGNLYSYLDELQEFSINYTFDIIPLTATIRKLSKGSQKENEINELMDDVIKLLLNTSAKLDPMCEFTRYMDYLIEKI